MTDSFQGGSFEPERSEDYVAPLINSYKEINEGMNNYWTQELSNYKYAAQDAGQDMKLLANMSGTLGDIFKQKEEEQREEDIAKGYEWYYENGFSDEELNSYREAKAGIIEDGVAIDEAAAIWRTNGGDIWSSEEFRKMNPAMKQGAVTAYARSRLAEYNPKGDPRLKGATTYQEYKAAEAVYNREFFRKFKGINPVLLQEEGIYEKQRDLQQDAYSSWTTGREEEIDTQRKQIAQSNFVKCVNSKGGGSCFLQYVNERGPFVQNGPARREAIEIAKNLADNGLITDNMIKEMRAKNDKNKFTSFADGKEYYYGDYFAADINEIEQKKADYENEKYRREKTGLEITHRNQTDKLLEELTPEGGFEFDEGFTQDQITLFKNLKANQLSKGNYDGRIDTILSEMSLDKNQLKASKQEALELAKKGLLTKDKLATFPVLVASDGNLQNIAATIDAGNGQGKEHKTLLETFISSELSVGKGTFGQKQVARWAKSEYAKKVEAYTGKVDNPHELAYQDVLNTLNSAVEANNAGKDHFLRKAPGKWRIETNFGDDFVKVKTESLEDFQEYREEIKTIPNAVSTTPMFNPTFLESFNETFGSSAGTIPQKAHTIAEIHNAMYPNDRIDAFEVIQRQRELVNLERLTEPAFLKDYRDLDPEEIKKYEQYKTPNTNVRVNATSGKENVNLIPLDQGGLFKEYAEANGTSFAEFAAAMEILPKLDLDFGVENPFEQLDDYEFLEYNKALFKYSGGTNKEALANTIRTDFK
jgi:hypothetical protein